MSEPFRDPEAGALARRTALLGRRRDELVMMPHAVRRVVVARWARISGAIAAWLAAFTMVIAALSPTAANAVARLLPGHAPAPLATLLVSAWVLGVVGYFIARSAAEHRFAVAMSRTVLPGEDLFHDIERLDHVHPDEVARGMAHRLEVLSAALPVAAAAAILPATAAYVAMGVAAHGWPSEVAFEAWLVAHASALAMMSMLGLAASVVMTKRAARLPIAAPIAATIAFGAASGTIVWWWLVGPAAIAATIAVIARRLRKERERILAEDPAAGSEVFTLRGFIREVRATAAKGRAFVRAHKRGFAIAAVSVPILAIGWRALQSSDEQTRHVDFITKVPTVEVAATPTTGVTPHSTFQLTPASCIGSDPNRGTDCVQLEVVFHDHQPVEVPSVFPGLSAIPARWRARVIESFVSAPRGHGFSVIAFPRSSTDYDQSPQWLDAYHSNGLAEAGTCAAPTPAGVRVRPDPDGPDEQRVTMLLAPSLTLARGCTLD
jgi:hypothetical protein